MTRNRTIHRLALVGFVVSAALTATSLRPGSAGAQTTVEPSVNDEAWYFRGKPPAPVVPTPAGPVSPGSGVPPAPQAPQGAFVVSFAGGTPGDSDTGGDTAWTAFSWDVLDAIGGTVSEFVVTLTQAPDNRGDVNAADAPIQACNIVAPWAGAPESNPWPTRPTVDCSAAIAPTIREQEGRLTFTFDVTPFATTWVEGTGYGIVIRPGQPDAEPPLPPFQVTFAGYTTQAENVEAVRPRVTFRFTGGLDDFGDFDGGFGDGDFGGGSFDTGFDSGFDAGFAPNPDIDVFPDDAGSAPDAAGPAPSVTDDEPGRGAAPRPISADRGFPVVGWLLLPLAALAFFTTGTALGPAGDPALPRQGGVSKVLAERRAARVAGDLPPLDSKG